MRHHTSDGCRYSLEIIHSRRCHSANPAPVTHTALSTTNHTEVGVIEGDCDVLARDASHWSYAASVMANHCAHIANRGVTDPAALPEGVRISLHQFLTEALEALDEDDLHSDALHVARDALDAALTPPLRKPADVRKYLQILADVVQRCATPQPLTEEQRGYARKAIAFFQAIVRAGDDADAHRAFADDELDELEFA